MKQPACRNQRRAAISRTCQDRSTAVERCRCRSIVRGAENAGLTQHLLRFGERFNLQHLGVFTLVTAILSNMVSNVPAVMLLKSLVAQFSNPHSAWLTLAMASTLAGNLTITGSVANIIVVKRAQKEAVITFLDYFRIGLPVTLLTLLLGWLWLSYV